MGREDVKETASGAMAKLLLPAASYSGETLCQWYLRLEE